MSISLKFNYQPNCCMFKFDFFIKEEVIEDSTKEETEISKLLGSKQTQICTCLKCNNKTNKEATVLVQNLVYPDQKGIY